VEELGVAGGWQDHLAAAYGGALALDFGAVTGVARIPTTPAFAEALAARCLLVYTGETRISGANISAVLAAYAAREAPVLRALGRMAALAREMAASLRAGDIDTLGRLVGEHWVHQRGLHPAITTGRIDEIVRRAGEAGALGAKALGASGGGCVVVVTGPDPAPVRSALETLGTLLPYSIDVEGAVAEVAG
jgi:D-glycero-alpha-D-manno-heptose-7-phosphate kinase